MTILVTEQTRRNWIKKYYERKLDEGALVYLCRKANATVIFHNTGEVSIQ